MLTVISVLCSSALAQSWIPHSVATLPSGTMDLAVGDIDSDGLADVIVADGLGPHWYQNQGGGTFGPAVAVGNGNLPWRMELHDFGGDGDLDLLLSYLGGIGFAENLGGGTFDPVVVFGSLGGGHVEAADVDGDGQLDLAAADPTNDTLYWRANNGGVFGPPVVFGAMSYLQSQDISVADFNGDGTDDVLFASGNPFAAPSLDLYDNTAGVFGPPHVMGESTGTTVPADLDNDGDIDFLATQAGFGYLWNLRWFENQGQTFVPHAIGSCSYIFSPSNNSAAAADLDGDGLLDVVCAAHSELHLYANLGGGQFGLEVAIPLPATEANRLQAADIDGDGDIDLVTSADYTTEVLWFENTLPQVGPLDTGLPPDTDTDTDTPADTDKPVDTDSDGQKKPGRGKGDSGTCGCSHPGGAGGLTWLILALAITRRRVSRKP